MFMHPDYEGNDPFYGGNNNNGDGDGGGTIGSGDLLSDEDGNSIIGNNISPENKEKNFQLVANDFLSHYIGVKNPYTGDTYSFNSIEAAHEKYPIQFAGLLWSNEDYHRLQSDIKNGTLSFDIFYSMVAAYCDYLQRSVPKLIDLQEVFAINNNPQEALHAILFGGDFSLNKDFHKQSNAFIESFPIDWKLKNAWLRVIQSLGVGIVTLPEYIAALVEEFPELQSVTNWQEVQNIFWDIKHDQIFSLLLKKSKHTYSSQTMHSLISGGLIMDEIVKHVKKNYFEN